MKIYRDWVLPIILAVSIIFAYFWLTYQLQEKGNLECLNQYGEGYSYRINSDLCSNRSTGDIKARKKGQNEN